MQFVPLAISGAWRIELDRLADERGWFARSFCAEEFAARGLAGTFPQSNISFNRQTGALRGMHFQAAPRPDPKLVRCTHGAAYDVVLDLRPDSPSYLRWEAVELTAEAGTAVYIPGGCAHGFQCLAPDTQLFYQMGESYVPELARGVRWNDPAFGIAWPLPVSAINERDAAYPDFAP